MREFKVGDIIRDKKTGKISKIVEIGESGGIFWIVNCTPEQRDGWIHVENAELYNPSLTIQDLENMDGERVWVENIDKDYLGCDGWYEVHARINELRKTNNYYSFDYNEIKIYRHKPEWIDNMENKGCEYCSDLGKYKSIHCEMSHQVAADDEYNIEIKSRYSPNCGRQLIKTFTTDQAAAKLSELLGEDVEVV